MITYAWNITGLDNNDDGIVETIHWLLEATNETKLVVETGDLALSAPNPETPFIQFEHLTKQDLVRWLEANLDVSAIKGRLNEQLQETQG